MTTTIPRPPFDPELEAVLAVLAEQLPVLTSVEQIPHLRTTVAVDENEQFITDSGLARRDLTIPGHQGDEIMVTVLSRPDHQGQGPGIYHTHGGGMIAGNRFVSAPQLAQWISAHDAVAVSVEYRLAPEFPDPYPVEDCYAGLVWTAEHAAELGIDPDRIMIAGASAGGGLAAGTALLARDRQGPKLIGQALICPMLDDRNESLSTQQIDGIGVWDRNANLVGWTALLGERRGTDDVSIYAAPARATELSNLPPAFIDVGSAEVFRDEDVAYASALWAAGSQAELHVWPGGFHGFDMLAPHVGVSQAAIEARNAWVARLLAG
ncbi:lipase [Enemella evansiae]|uniref:Lipase n=1 Tax=Enemella evansiae TaxID=2016499 RepID=A0A255G758_9ACTN|nr:alpha/beta hydrolase [Enemella evansiae]OYO08684.1 lipase [Enemella evansiae]